MRRRPLTKPELHLSVVATSRNDDHGEGMLERMQHFVDGFVAQCRRHELSVELILVEWNPPGDRPPLIDALKWPANLGPCSIRIITVPPEVHARFEHAEKLPLFQMIAKNVGIRRARGEYVLATNVDILFSDDVVLYMREHLQPGRVVRVDRYDIPDNVPTGVSFNNILNYCNKNFFRIHARLGTFSVKEGRLFGEDTLLTGTISDYYRFKLPRPAGRQLSGNVFSLGIAVAKGSWRLATRIPRLVRKAAVAVWRQSASEHGFLQRLRATWPYVRGFLHPLSWVVKWLFWKPVHTNACGDFTLLSRDDWFRIRGYAEWAMYSMHIDSVLMYSAVNSGVKHVQLGSKYRIYHIEHRIGSGWTPEGQKSLYDRLTMAGIPYLSDEELRQIAERMAKTPDARVVNDEDWGLGEMQLPEAMIRNLEARQDSVKVESVTV